MSIRSQINWQNTAVSLKLIHFIDKPKLILIAIVRNSTINLTLMSNSSWMSIKHLPFRFPPQVRGLWILKDRLGPEHPVIEPEIWWALLVVFEFSQPERNSILAILLCPRSTELLKSGLQGPFRKKRKIGKCKYCFDFFLKLMYFLWNLRPFVKGSANTYQN